MKNRNNTRAYRTLQSTFLVLTLLFLTLESKVSFAAEQTTIGIMSGGVNGTYVRIAQNISDVLDSSELRIVTMLGKGSQQNIKDLIELDGIDLAIVQSDVLARVARTNEIPGASSAIRYVTKLYNEEVHIVTTKSVASLKFLEGAEVAVGRAGSGTEMTASILFEGLGFQINPINVSGQEAIDALENELISAAVFVVGKPSKLLQEIERSSNLKLIDIKLPKNVPFPYFDAQLTSNDYPNLIDNGQAVSTVAVGAILSVFNWREGSRRYQILDAFTKNLFDSIDFLKGGSYHPKWAEVDVNVNVPGWTRFRPAEQWIADQ